jgi:putative membrane fusion protein
MVIKKVKQSKKVKSIYYLLFIFLFISFTFINTGFFRDMFISKILENRILQYTKIQREVNTEGLLIKGETIVRMPERGKVKYLVKDGTRLRAGVPVVSLQSTELNSVEGKVNTLLYTKQAGIFCLHLDGLEQVLSPDNLDVLQVPKIKEIKSTIDDLEASELKDAAIIESGEPVYKLVDNLKPLLIKLELNQEQIPQNVLKLGYGMKLQWQGYSFNGKVVDCRKQDSNFDILLRADDYPHDLAHYRKIALVVVTQALSGLAVERRSIVLKEGQPGIYSLNKTLIRWLPVKIEAQSENNVIISGAELAEGTSYIHNPFWYKVVSLVL